MGLTGFPSKGPDALSYSVPPSQAPGGAQPSSQPVASACYCGHQGSQRDSPFWEGLPSSFPED